MPLLLKIKGQAFTAEANPQTKPGALIRNVNTRLSAAEANPQTKPGGPAAAPAAALARGLGRPSTAENDPRAKPGAPAAVVIVRGKGVLARKNSADPKILGRMYERGFRLLAGQSDIAAGLRAIFSPSDRVGIKINAIAAPELTTPPEVCLPFARLLTGIGIPERNVIIWDRTNRELKDAGYRLNLDADGFKIFGTDTAGAGYPGEPVSHLNIGSLFSAIQMSRITASVSFAVLKDHGMAGITAGLKNYYGAVHNPNKYHDDNCDPFVAELFDAPPIKAKHRLTILDALVVQYHRGPSYHARWAETMETLVFSLDPVAADFIGWQIVERLRKEKGLPSLEEDRRLPSYLRTAERMGLGKAAMADIKVVEDEV